MVVVVNALSWSIYPLERCGTHCIGGWFGHGAGLEGVRKGLAQTGIRSQDRPAHKKSL